MENPSPFYWTKVMDVGTSHPIIARISSGISDLLHLWQVSDDKKRQTRDLCYDIARDLIEAEKQALPVIREIEEIEANLEKVMPTTRPNSIESVLSIENTKSFLKFSKAALKKFANLLGIIFEKDFPEPKFKDINDWLAKKLFNEQEEEYLILKILKHYQPFGDELVARRNREEHPHKKGEIFVMNYEIKKNKEAFILVRPCFYDKVPVLEYLKNTMHMSLHFIEEALVAAISINLHPAIAVFEIPTDKRNPQFPKRFRLDLSGNQY